MTVIGKLHLRNDNEAPHRNNLSASQVSASIKILDFMSNGLDTSIRSLPYCNNRVLFVSGERGSGKSSMIRSLQVALTDMRMYARDSKFAGYDRDRGRSDQSDVSPDDDSVKARRETLRIQLNACVRDHGWHEKVRWLTPLSLDPLPKGTNMVGALLSRIQDTVALESSDETVRGGSIMHASAQLERVRHSLDNLKTDALMAYESNIAQASEYQEPENNALQAGHAELKKLGILRRLDQALEHYFNAASDAQEMRKMNKGMFVQIIDDIDSRPTRAVEALKLAHSFSVPRLLFVIIGEQRAIDRMMYFDVKGEFEKVTSKNDPVTNRDVDAVANEQSSSLFRKLIPLGQRIHVEDMTLRESLDFPVDTAGTGPGGRDEHSRNETLADQLDKCLLSEAEMSCPSLATKPGDYHGPSPWSLCDLLTCDLRAYSMLEDLRYGGRDREDVDAKAKTEAEAGAREGARSAATRANPAIRHDILDLPIAYDGAHLLTSPPRQTSDFSHILEDLVDSGSERDEKKQRYKYIKLLNENLKRLIDEDGPLGAERQQQLRQCLHENGSGWVFEAPSLTSRPHIADHIAIQPQSGSRSKDVDIRFSLASAEYWEVEIPKCPTAPDVDDLQPLGKRTRPAYKLLHDAVLLSGSGVCTKRLKLKCRGHDNLARLIILSDDGETSIPLLTCTWMTFWHLDQFSALWDAGLERLHLMRLEASEITPEQEVQIAIAYWCYALLLTALAGVNGAPADPAERMELSSPPVMNDEKMEKWRLNSEAFLEGEEKKSPIEKLILDLTDRLIVKLDEKMNKGEDDAMRIQISSALINILCLDSLLRTEFPDPEKDISIPWLKSCADKIHQCYTASLSTGQHYSTHPKFALDAAIVHTPGAAAETPMLDGLMKLRPETGDAVRRLRRRLKHHATRAD